MDHWTELRTALKLAQLGTVSAAAAALGVHRATINRHVDTLEGALGAPLFQRHARGYTLTDAGRDMLEVAGRADEMFEDLEGRNKSRASQLSGNLVITSLSGVAALIMPSIRAFHQIHPDIELTYITGENLARLEYGEAHIAIRAGKKPDMPDYVVRPFRPIEFGLFASQSYIAQYGHPKGGSFAGHRFVGAIGQNSRRPFSEWMTENVTRDMLALETNDPNVAQEAICAGMGLGFLAAHDASACQDLVALLPPSGDFKASLWLVTHVDLHRTAKVQAFLQMLKITGT